MKMLDPPTIFNSVVSRCILTILYSHIIIKVDPTEPQRPLGGVCDALSPQSQLILVRFIIIKGPLKSDLSCCQGICIDFKNLNVN